MKRLFAEWERQSSLLFALPHQNTDWLPYLDEILLSYEKFIKTAAKYQHCTVLCANKEAAGKLLGKSDNITLIELPTNDTWIRDFGAIDVEDGDEIISYDFTFNAWGGKFEAGLDNAVNEKLFKLGKNRLVKVDMVLEGGSIDSNGDGVLLTTAKCLLEENRNPDFGKNEIDAKLKELFGLKRIIWLDNGFLKGDDTDSHVDTLARFITKDTIAYTVCEDEEDEHFEELKKMEEELKNTGFKLLPLPLPKPVFFEGERLPATYANFVFVNGAVLVPTYGDKNDLRVQEILKAALPNHKIEALDAKVFIRQHGSLHCASMNRFCRGTAINI
ncbi:MAG: agmatine deiminase family protein [Campylobacteraceae bacterium]|jgi:agmatine/peptidylarginine deiminase|nr:agmatine deiminase family protein [Campylobacteraceae bacterium]